MVCCTIASWKEFQGAHPKGPHPIRTSFGNLSPEGIENSRVDLNLVTSWPHDAKKEAKIGANLEAKIDTYLEVKHGAKWGAKVVAKMNAILDANMVLLRTQIWR